MSATDLQRLKELHDLENRAWNRLTRAREELKDADREHDLAMARSEAFVVTKKAENTP